MPPRRARGDVKQADCRIRIDFLLNKAIFRRNPDGFQGKSAMFQRKRMPSDGVLAVLKQTLVVYQVRNCKLRMEEDFCTARRTTPCPAKILLRLLVRFLTGYTTRAVASFARLTRYTRRTAPAPFSPCGGSSPGSSGRFSGSARRWGRHPCRWPPCRSTGPPPAGR